jgi:transposase
MPNRRKYSLDFKRGAVEQAQQAGVSCAQIARELGVSANLLTRWRREAELAEGKAFAGTGSPRDEEVARLKRELARVKKERDFLREAAIGTPPGTLQGSRPEISGDSTLSR